MTFSPRTNDERPDIERWRRSFRVPPAPLATAPGRAPSISIIIAAHQAAATIPDAVRSALDQTVPAHEVIVCDDGSTDDLEAVLAPYRDKILYLRKERGGPASARNAAAKAASGEFLAILDADDEYLPQRVEALGALAAARPDLDILATDAYLVREGEVVGRFSESTRFNGGDQGAAILDRCFCAWPALRRSQVFAAGGFDESLRTGSDWEFVIRLILGGSRAGLVDEPLYLYRLRSDSLTADRVQTLRQRLEMLERVRQPGLTATERVALDRSLARQRRALLLTELEAKIRRGEPDARRQALAVVRTGGIGPATRLRALGSAVAPGLARRLLERQVRFGGRSRLDRSVPPNR